MTLNAADLIKTVEMDGVEYKVAMASAKDQRSVMYLLAHYGMEAALQQVSMARFSGTGADTAALGIMGTLMARIPEHDFNRILDTILAKVSLVSDGSMVTINTFQGKMQDYIKLGILALGVNFADFTGLLSLFRSSTATTGDQEKQGQEQTQQSTGSSGDHVQE